MNTGRILYRCDRCGCLVVASTLRLSRYRSASVLGNAGNRSDLVCGNAAACLARSPYPPHWRKAAALSSLICEPPEQEPLLRCARCDLAAHSIEVVVRRTRDEQGWFEEVVCEDDGACGTRQRWHPELNAPEHPLSYYLNRFLAEEGETE